MSNKPLIPESKLPSLGTTIFSQMSALAQQHQAINLSQGFPDFDGPRYLQERLARSEERRVGKGVDLGGRRSIKKKKKEKTKNKKKRKKK